MKTTFWHRWCKSLSSMQAGPAAHARRRRQPLGPAAYDRTNSFGLWKSDGTVAGTTLVKDIFPGNSSCYPASFSNLNGTLFFSATDGATVWERWKSDGTAAAARFARRRRRYG